MTIDKESDLDMVEFLGHIDHDNNRKQSLLAHLEGTAHLAGNHAAAFGERAMGEIVGRYHDIGKYSKEFQNYIRQGGGRKVDHSTAGAQFLINVCKKWAEALIESGISNYELECQLSEADTNVCAMALCIAGHHGGIPNQGGEDDTYTESTLSGRIKRTNIPDYKAYDRDLIKPVLPQSDLLTRILKTGNIFGYMFYVRMLFSCLVDGDFLDTERFMSAGKVKRSGFLDMAELKQRFDTYVEKNYFNPQTAINKKRCEILEQSIAAGKFADTKLYNMTVPTGGGKTIASLAFALNYAVNAINRPRRIIYVIPYTSIIEQNASEFRKILGYEQVVEHHMQVNYDADDSDDNYEDINRKRLATENWDAPLIVTTNVQFFESLFANRPSKCRKLHNITNSIIIFDESQMLPVNYLKPCMRVIQELVANYNCTAVLCSATQPSLQKFFPGDMHIAEICPNIKEYAEFFKRTTIKMSMNKIDIAGLADKIQQQEQVLCIVNTKTTAQEVFDLLEGEGNYHLSTNLYPEHRSRVLNTIRERLRTSKPCRVVSTSLVEAGVDLDFPYVLRELAGLDNIVQAAGRCNRNAFRNKEDSIVEVFNLDRKLPLYIQLNAAQTESVHRNYPDDLDNPEAIACYFDGLHTLAGKALDSKEILKIEYLKRCAFQDMAKKVKLIDTNTKSVLIPLEDKAREYATCLRRGEYSRSLFRAAGRYMVNVYCGGNHQPYEKLLHQGLIEVLDENIAILLYEEAYDDEKGLMENIELGMGIFA